jgi:hypothetical protein
MSPKTDDLFQAFLALPGMTPARAQKLVRESLDLIPSKKVKIIHTKSSPKIETISSSLFTGNFESCDDDFGWKFTAENAENNQDCSPKVARKIIKDVLADTLKPACILANEYKPKFHGPKHGRAFPTKCHRSGTPKKL